MNIEQYILPDEVTTLRDYDKWQRGISIQDEPSPEDQRIINERIRASKAAKRAADRRKPEPVEIAVVSLEACRRRGFGVSRSE